MADLLRTIEGVATLLIALYVASIGTFQWLAARQKLRLDLYNRRFEIYVAAVSFMQALMEWGSLSNDVKRQTRVEFVRSHRESRFLFGDDQAIFRLLGEVNDRSFSVMGFVDEAAPNMDPATSKLQALYTEKQANLDWIIAATERLEGMLVPYLAFGRSAIRRPANRH